LDAGLLIAVGSALLIALLAGHLLARAGFPVPEARKRIGCVDGLRGYLALLVMMHHCDLWIAQTQFGQPWGASSSLLFHNFGPAGVALFFMTTGLVFYPRIRRGFQGVDWRATYLSRVFRILPLQLVLIAAVSGLSIYLGDPFNRGTVRQNLSALAGWLTTHGEPPLFGYDNAGAINAFVLWSLWYEWIFYLFVLPVLSLLRGVLGDRLPPFAIPVGCLLVGLTIGSITPPVMAAKWERKLKEEIASTSGSGAQPRKASSTRGAPEMVSRKQATTLTMKAITWLEVAAETQAPMERYAPAIKKLPI